MLEARDWPLVRYPSQMTRAARITLVTLLCVAGAAALLVLLLFLDLEIFGLRYMF